MRFTFRCSIKRGLVRSSRTMMICRLLMLMSGAVGLQSALASPTTNILAPHNLVPWEVQWVRDGGEMKMDERARLLKAKGLHRYAVMYRRGKLANLESQIEVFRQHGLEITAVYFWLDTERPGEDPDVKAAFESFKRLRVQPRIWVSQSNASHPKTMEDWKNALREAGFIWVEGKDNFGSAFSSRADFTDQQKERFFKALHRVNSEERDLPHTPQEQARRLEREAARIGSLSRLASKYGLNVELYNHNGWFGLMENQLAIIERLQKEEIRNVRIVYTFWHARDSLHDDVNNFDNVWMKIRPYVGMIAIRGVRGEMESLYPSEGEDELQMMRVVHLSGWKGAVGVLCLDPGVDPEIVLENTLRGTKWLAAELSQPGAGGARPLSRSNDIAPEE